MEAESVTLNDNSDAEVEHQEVFAYADIMIYINELMSNGLYEYIYIPRVLEELRQKYELWLVYIFYTLDENRWRGALVGLTRLCVCTFDSSDPSENHAYFLGQGVLKLLLV